MKISKWGNSLAVRIPKDVAASLGVEEGDELVLSDNHGAKSLSKKMSRQEAMRAFLSRPKLDFGPDYKWSREEAYREDE